MARPSKLTNETEKAICDAIRDGATYAAASEAAGIAYATFNEWMKDERVRYVKFSEAVREANAQARTELIKQIKQHGRKDWRALAWILERRFKGEYGAAVDVTHLGNLEIGIKQIDYRNGVSIPATRSSNDSGESGEN